MATLKAQVRDTKGKGAARKMRSAGRIPAVAYGHGDESRSLSIDAHELDLLLARINPENTIIDLEVDGGEGTQALIREIQHHPSRPYILHVDFFQIHAGEKITVDVPIRLEGTPVGVANEGGILQEVLRELTVSCLPKDIPSSVTIEVSELGMGDSIQVSAVTLPDVEILNDAELTICTVVAPTIVAAPETDEDEEGLEPEIVGEDEAEEEGEAAEE